MGSSPGSPRSPLLRQRPVIRYDDQPSDEDEATGSFHHETDDESTRKEAKRSPKLEHKAVTRVKSMMSIECPNTPQRTRPEESTATHTGDPAHLTQRGQAQQPCRKGELAGICTFETVVLKRAQDESFGLDLEIKSDPLKVMITGLKPGGAAERVKFTM